MKKIGITQRYDACPERNELREALDVNLSSFISKLGFIPVPICSNIEDRQRYLKQLDLDGCILSGGNNIGEFPMRDAMESMILEVSIASGMPVLGICRGMQFINHYQGGCLSRVAGHVATKHELLTTDWVRKNGIQMVNSFHDHGILESGIGEGLAILASTNDGVVEALAHKSKPWLGVMWHPEREPAISCWDSRIIINHFNHKNKS